MGDNDAETMNNILHAKWDFDAEAFENVSEEAKDFISSLLVPAKWYSSIHHYSATAKYTPSHTFYHTYFDTAFLLLILLLSGLLSCGFKSLTFLFHLSIIALYFDLLMFP